jgi:hypothetical protein
MGGKPGDRSSRQNHVYVVYNRGHDAPSRRRESAPVANSPFALVNPLKTLKTAMGRACNKLA